MAKKNKGQPTAQHDEMGTESDKGNQGEVGAGGTQATHGQFVLEAIAQRKKLQPIVDSFDPKTAKRESADEGEASNDPAAQRAALLQGFKNEVMEDEGCKEALHEYYIITGKKLQSILEEAGEGDLVVEGWGNKPESAYDLINEELRMLNSGKEKAARGSKGTKAVKPKEVAVAEFEIDLLKAACNRKVSDMPEFPKGIEEGDLFDSLSDVGQRAWNIIHARQEPAQ